MQLITRRSQVRVLFPLLPKPIRNDWFFLWDKYKNLVHRFIICILIKSTSKEICFCNVYGYGLESFATVTLPFYCINTIILQLEQFVFIICSFIITFLTFKRNQLSSNNYIFGCININKCVFKIIS